VYHHIFRVYLYQPLCLSEIQRFQFFLSNMLHLKHKLEFIFADIEYVPAVKGVSPYFPGLFISAPLFIRNYTVSVFPFEHATFEAQVRFHFDRY
jgi:hypothetical protein